jgi:hypothetical protein
MPKENASIRVGRAEVPMLALLAVALVACVPHPVTPSSGPSADDLAGQTFVGPPTGETSREGCEGCGEPGELAFRADGGVEVIFPGSDIVDGGTWTRSGNAVTVVLYDQETLQLDLAGSKLTLHGPGYDLELTRR